MTIQEIQTLVQQAPGSIYTREDVISLLNRITFPEAKPQGEVNIDHLIEILEESMENLAGRRLDAYLAKDFDTSSNYGDSLTIECEVTLDTSSFVRDAVEESREEIEKLFEGPSSETEEPKVEW